MKLVFIIIAFIVICCLIRKQRYENTEYFQQTHVSYDDIKTDKGRIGEYYIYDYLKSLPGYRKYLFNLYIPKEDNTTAEIDVVLLHESGIYVMESKNFSGQIYGDESDRYWTQILKTETGPVMYNFCNPVVQNSNHIKYLKRFLADETLPVYSYVVFSDRCMLKNTPFTNESCAVVNRYNLLSAVEQNIENTETRLSPERIEELYAELYPFTQAEEAVKSAHIANIKRFAHSSI